VFRVSRVSNGPVDDSFASANTQNVKEIGSEVSGRQAFPSESFLHQARDYQCWSFFCYYRHTIFMAGARANIEDFNDVLSSG
jgi:hypothetical protein